MQAGDCLFLLRSARGRIALCLAAVTALIFVVDVRLYQSTSAAARELIAIRSIRVRTTYSPLAARHVTNHHTRDELPQPSLEQSMDLSARRPDIQEAPMGYKSGSDDGSIDRPEAGGASSALPLTGQELKGSQQSKRRRRSIWMPCYNETEAERLHVYQWQSARPKGMSSKEFERVAKCWHKRTKNDPLLAAEELPPTSLLKLRMEEDWLRDFLFVHRGNIERLGKGFSDDEGGTLADNSEVLAYLPASGAEAMQTVRRRDCAAVGSGGSLHGSRQGRVIDRHEAVLRVNEAPVVGFQQDVGRRTDMRLINNLWSDKYSAGPSASRPLEDNVTLISTRADGNAFLELGAWMSRKRPDVTLRLMSTRVVSAVREGVLNPWRNQLNASGIDVLEAAVLEGRDTPSSGLVAVFLLLQLCKKVTVYGFTGINDGAKYHYYKTARRYQNRTHSFTAERALFRALHRDGLIDFVDGNLDLIHTWV